MRRQDIHYALLVAALLVAPACGNSNGAGTGMSNDRDQPATERAAGQTNSTATEDPSRPDRAGTERATGTSGSVRRTTEADMGVGPDAAITMKVQAAYAGDDVVKGRNIDVDTDNGVVTLKGSVDSLHERDAAEQIARETDGVKRVVNTLTVVPPR